MAEAVTVSHPKEPINIPDDISVRPRRSPLGVVRIARRRAAYARHDARPRWQRLQRAGGGNAMLGTTVERIAKTATPLMMREPVGRLARGRSDAGRKETALRMMLALPDLIPLDLNV